MDFSGYAYLGSEVIMPHSFQASVLNFFLTESFEEKYDLRWTLWGGTAKFGFE